jgi:outer membrane protein assembly factor BamB
LRSTPPRAAVRDGRVYAGSFNGWVVALDAARGKPLWKFDTRGAVVSTPAPAGDRLVVGNRTYDLLGLNARTGAVAWKRYIWGSWVESSASVLGDVAYVGSSDADAVFAIDARSGRRLWATDVHGWTWGQPAVTDRTVYAGVSGLVGYPVPQVAGVVAMDRATGAVRWHLETAAPAAGAFGIPGSVAVGGGRVYAGGLDGRVVALPQ